MPASFRVVAAAVVAVLALVGMVVVVVRVRADESDVGHLRFASTTPAAAPFSEFTEARVAVGPKCLRVLVAANPGQRTQGLRDVRQLAPYAGMLFVNPRDTRDRFTMANTPTALDITFFSAQGVPVGTQHMTPCPDGTDATCPVYESKAAYRYALERPAGSGSAGALAGCAA